MRIYDIKVNGKRYKVEVAGISEVSPTEVKSVATTSTKAPEVAKETPVVATSQGQKTVVAPMQGTIMNVLVQVGKDVNVGDTVVVLEAMKMENEIKSAVAGKVVEVKANKGQNVNSKDILIVLE